jgi:enolase-phosphatase E1
LCSTCCFPYAAKHLPDFVRQQATRADVAEQLVAVRRDSDEPNADVERVIEILLGWIAEDRKATPAEGVARDGLGAGLSGRAVERARVSRRCRSAQATGIRRAYQLFVYSSGSIQAQKLIFGCSEAGDLTPLFSGYFDTTSGPKREAQSYASALLRLSVWMPRRFCFYRTSSRNWTRRVRCGHGHVRAGS